MKNSGTGKNIVKEGEPAGNYRKKIPKGSFKSEEAFMEIFGLWKNRKISLEQIRKKAWR